MEELWEDLLWRVWHDGVTSDGVNDWVNSDAIREAKKRIKADEALMQQALKAMQLAKSSHGVFLASDPPQDAWKINAVDSRLGQIITALYERLKPPR